MSETVFRLLIREITTLRVICTNPRCGSVLQVALQRLADTHGPMKCPVCEQTVQRGVGGSDNLLATLADTLLKLQRADYVEVGIEVVVPPAKAP